MVPLMTLRSYFHIRGPLCLTSCFLPPQLLQRCDVTWTPRAHSAVLHQRESRALAAQRLPLRWTAECTAVRPSVASSPSTSCGHFFCDLLHGHFLFHFRCLSSWVATSCHCLVPVLFPFFSYFLSLAISCNTSCLRLLPMLLPVRPLPFPLPVSQRKCGYFLSVSVFCATACLFLHYIILPVMATSCIYYASVATSCVSGLCFLLQEETDWQWRQAMDYLSAVSELNYMTQIVIMLYEDNDKVGGALLPPP